jgi:hypothetical protein
LEDGYGICPCPGVWVNTVRHIECVPMGPIAVQVFGSLIVTPQIDPLVNSAEVSAECSCLGSGQICQGQLCGKTSSKCASNCELGAPWDVIKQWYIAIMMLV